MPLSVEIERRTDRMEIVEIIRNDPSGGINQDCPIEGHPGAYWMWASVRREDGTCEPHFFPSFILPTGINPREIPKEELTALLKGSIMQIEFVGREGQFLPLALPPASMTPINA